MSKSEKLVSDDQLLADIAAAREAGDTRLNGLPAVSDVADHTELSKSRLQDRIPTLRDAGRIRLHRTTEPGTTASYTTIEVTDAPNHDD